MIRLSIKGNNNTAKKAAKKHGIATRSCGYSKKTNTSFCDTPCKLHSKVAKWYAEPAGPVVEGRGYKAGTLLFFSMKDC